jgi:hypothetical protein
MKVPRRDKLPQKSSKKTMKANCNKTSARMNEGRNKTSSRKCYSQLVLRQLLRQSSMKNELPRLQPCCVFSVKCNQQIVTSECDPKILRGVTTDAFDSNGTYLMIKKVLVWMGMAVVEGNRVVCCCGCGES